MFYRVTHWYPIQYHCVEALQFLDICRSCRVLNRGQWIVLRQARNVYADAGTLRWCAREAEYEQWREYIESLRIVYLSVTTRILKFLLAQQFEPK